MIKTTLSLTTASALLLATGSHASTMFYEWNDGSALDTVITTAPGAYQPAGEEFWYIQQSQNNAVYAQVLDTIPNGSEVTVNLRMADFHQSWSTGSDMTFGFFSSEPTTGNITSGFVYSGSANVPNYDGTAVTNGLPEGAAYQTTFTTTSDLVNPYFVVRIDTPNNTNNNAARIAIDDVSVTYVPEPSSTALLGLGGLALMLRRRK